MMRDTKVSSDGDYYRAVRKRYSTDDRRRLVKQLDQRNISADV